MIKKEKINNYFLRRGLVNGYKIGLHNDLEYVPIPDRDVFSFKEFKGEIEVMLPDGRKMSIKNWKDRIYEEVFQDKQGRGSYKIGYFLFNPIKPLTEEEKLKKLCQTINL